jgi:S1-C subfamily serine protease
MKKIFYLSVIILLIFSCKSTETVEKDPDYANMGIENIKHNFSKEKIDLFESYILANKYLTKLKDTDPKYEQTKKYISEIISDMDKSVTTNFNDKKYSDALKYSLSLRSLKVDSTIKLEEIYEKYSKELDVSSDIFTKNSLKEEMADIKILPEKEVADFLKYYANQKSRGVYFYLYDKYSNLYPDLLNKYPELKKLYQEMKDLNNLNFEELMQSVVTVILKKGMNVKNGMGYFDNSIGTGFFIDDNGYILTNHHVIADHVNPKYEGYSAVYVTTRDDPDTEIPAKVIGYDKVFDIALLKINKKNEKHLTLGRSVDMKVGDKVYTIGNPIGIKYTVTSGIISNKEIDFFQLGRAFQVDAAVNPGNSGGPLIDEKGQVVGIIFAGIPQYANINFAIPFQWVAKTIPSLYKGGEVKRSWVGGALYNEKDKTTFYYILPGGPLEKAGVKVGDILTKIDGIDVKTTEEAQSMLSWRKHPMLISLEIDRNGTKKNVVVKLEERPYLPVAEAFEKDTQGKLMTLIYGIDLEYFDKSIFVKKYKVNKVYKKMLASSAEISEGDILVVYDLKYVEKDKVILLTIRFKKKDLGILDRIITLPCYAEINSIL